MRQLDVFGGEHEAPAPLRAPAQPLELFAPDAFSARVPGTLALDLERAPDGPHAAAREPLPPLTPAEVRAWYRSVPCPTCGAGVGSPCRRPSGHTVFGGDVHAGRKDAALENGRPR